MVETIGLDIDGFDKKHLDKIQKNSVNYGTIQTKRTRHGHHIEVTLKKPMKLKESMWVRFYLNDDPLRLLFDCLRIISDIDDIDVLWDVKQKKQINELINKIEVLSK